MSEGGMMTIVRFTTIIFAWPFRFELHKFKSIVLRKDFQWFYSLSLCTEHQGTLILEHYKGSYVKPAVPGCG